MSRLFKQAGTGSGFKEKNLLGLKLNFSNQTLDTNAALLKTTIPYFEGMFRWDMKEKQTAEIDLQDTDPAIFSALIDFAFFNKLTITESNYLNLYERANYYGMVELQKQCCDWMSQNISENTFQDILALAGSHGLADLKKDCEAWLSAHADDFADKDLHSLTNHYQLNLVTHQDAIQDELLKCFADKKDLRKDKKLVKQLEHLEALDLTPFEKVPPPQLDQLISLCPNVKKLIAKNHAQDFDRRKVDTQRFGLIVKSMPKLESLTLSGYCITDFLPISALTQLRTLTIANSTIFEPNALCGLKDLEELNLEGHYFLPLSQLTNLQRLQIKFSRIKVKEIEGLTNLKSLSFEHVELFDNNVTAFAQNFDLAQLGNLETLILPDNSFLSLDNLDSLTKLHKLCARADNIDDLSIISKLSQLQELELCYVQGNLLNALPKLQNLKTLALSSDLHQIEVDAAFFANFGSLENLHLHGFVAKNSFLIPLPKLKSLALSTSSNFDISNLTELRRLDLFACQVRIPLAGLPKLKILDIRGSVNQALLNFGASDIKEFTPLLGPNLRSLSLKGSIIKDDLTFLLSATGLRKLDLTNFQIDSKDFDYSALSQLTTLEELNLSCTPISDLSVIAGLSNLKALDISFCEKIKSLEPLAKLIELQTLYLIHKNYHQAPAPPSLEPLVGLKKLKQVYYAFSWPKFQ